jgi:hypothetical protein
VLARTLLALVLFSVAGAGTAHAEPFPNGRLSAVGTSRWGTGGLADELGFGWGVGFEAGYYPMGPDQRLGWGVSWSTMLSFYGDGSSRVADQLALVEMDAGVRLRAALGARGRLVLFGGGGGALLRLNEPVTRNGDRSQVEPWGAAGLEFPVFGGVVGVSLRYGTIVDGSGTIGLELSYGRGV